MNIRQFIATSSFFILHVSFVLSYTAQDGNATSTALHACSELSEGDISVTFQSNASYEELRDENWSATARLTPLCIVQVSSTQQLSEVLKIVQATGAPFAVRSGGHEVEPGFANINGGILIDLANLNDITIQPESNTVIVGTGNRWQYVYEALEKENLIVVGGRATGPAVGGFTLGGGLSYFANQHGLACDNVVNFEVMQRLPIVLRSGDVVNANATFNSDLFTSLKGGLNNFGIVSHFTLSTYPSKGVWAGVMTYALNQSTEILTALEAYQTNPNFDNKSNIFVQFVPTNATSTGVGTSVTYFYSEPVARPDAFADFLKIKPISDGTAVQSMYSFINSTAISDATAAAPRWHWRTSTFGVDKTTFLNVFSIATNNLTTIESLTAGSLVVNFQPIQPSVVVEGKAKGGNVLGLQSTPQIWLTIAPGWFFPSDDGTARNFAKGIVEKIEEMTQSTGQNFLYKFLNDASKDQDVIMSYGSENVELMRNVSKKYDPTGTFQVQQPGGFKIPK